MSRRQSSLPNRPTAKVANDIPANKPKEYDAAIAAAFEQMNLAIPYFEKANALKPTDAYTMQCLKECYYKLRSSHPEYNDKYNDIKAKLEAAEHCSRRSA